MQRLFGASTNFYSGTCYGKTVANAPAMVREFAVSDITSRSLVVGHKLKVNRKTMKLDLGNFTVSMFETVEAATASLKQLKILASA